jgi:hypothetical protein
MAAIIVVSKQANSNISFLDANGNTVASLTDNAHARRIGMQGVEITDATGLKITVFAGVLEKMVSDAGTINNPTQQQVLGELATNFFRS